MPSATPASAKIPRALATAASPSQRRIPLKTVNVPMHTVLRTIAVGEEDGFVIHVAMTRISERLSLRVTNPSRSNQAGG